MDAFNEAVDRTEAELAQLRDLVSKATEFEFVPDLTEFYPGPVERQEHMDAEYGLRVRRSRAGDRWRIVGMHEVEWDATNGCWNVPHKGTVYTRDDALAAVPAVLAVHTEVVHGYLRVLAERGTRLRERWDG